MLACAAVMSGERVAGAHQNGQSACVTSQDEQPTVADIASAVRDGKVIEFTSDGVRVRDPRPTPDPGDKTAAEPVLDASGEPWLYVEHPDDPDFEFDLEVGYGDHFTHDHDADIEESVAFIRSLPGVTSAFRQDPEEIFVVGTRDALRVRDSLVEWWALRL
jgi:hypothetical protein